VVMTDHRIQRVAPRDALAPLAEAEPTVDGIAFLDPARAPSGREGDVYLVTTLLRAVTSAAAVGRLEALLSASAPPSLEPYFDLAKGQMRLKRFAQAEKTVRLLLSRRPDDPLLWQWLGVVDAGQGRLTEGIEALSHAVELSPDLPEAHFNLALLLEGRDDHEHAMRHLEAAVAGRPTLAAAWLYIGRISHRLDRLDAAASALEQALAIEPALTRAYVEWGEVLVEQGKHDEAMRLLRHGVETARDPAAVKAVLDRTGGPSKKPAEVSHPPRDSE